MTKEEVNLGQKSKDSKQVPTKFKEMYQDLDPTNVITILSKKRKQIILEKGLNLFPMLFNR